VRRLLIASLLAVPHPAFAQASLAVFYKDKTIDLVIGGGAGGSFDLYGRLFQRHLGDHLPGRPRVVARVMPGASGFAAVQWLATLAPRDGTAIAILPPQLAIQQALGLNTLRYDASKFAWIGRAARAVEATYTWHLSPTRTIEDAKRRETVMGSPTSGSSGATYLRLMNNVLGTRFKIVTGYNGTTEANLAIERGEIEGTSKPWNGLKVDNADWVRDHKIQILVQYGLERSPDLPDVPTLVDLAPTRIDRDAFSLLAMGPEMGRPFAAPEGAPPERVKALREAFDSTLEDPDFIADARAMNIDLSPAKGETVAGLTRQTLEFDADAKARAKRAVVE
jgi:tripartite-type tricarboxylate transporter receptor subunit TctC